MLYPGSTSNGCTHWNQIPTHLVFIYGWLTLYSKMKVNLAAQVRAAYYYIIGYPHTLIITVHVGIE